MGSRFGAHEKEAMASVGRSDKAARIREILAAGERPRVDIIRHALADDAAALLVEAAVIDALRPQLTNIVAGHGEGRLPLEELKVRYAAPLLGDDVPPALMVRLSSWQSGRLEIEPGYFQSGHGWRSGMSQIELADSTRAWWKISPKSGRWRGVPDGEELRQWGDLDACPLGQEQAGRMSPPRRRGLCPEKASRHAMGD